MAKQHAAGRVRRRIPLHRLEAFSDAVFAFAVTLLVVSLAIPATTRELFRDMQGFVAFGICFVFLIVIWVEHNRFFQSYPLTDPVTVTLNMALLFVVLLYVYPMKFLFTLMVGQFMGTAPSNAVESESDVHVIMIIYGLGVLGLNAILLLMRVNAERHGPALELTPRDYVELHADRLRNVLSGCIALASILIAAFTADPGIYSGFVYFLLLPAHLYVSRHMRLALQKIGQHETGRSAPETP